MTFIKFALVAAVALGAAAITLPALAGEARASGDVPVRDGPGGRYDIIDYLDDGEYYEVEDCTRRANWCLVSDGREELGWVRGSYLVGMAAKNAVTPFEFLSSPELVFRQPD
jgi:uncharacterized protein YraI